MLSKTAEWQILTQPIKINLMNVDSFPHVGHFFPPMRNLLKKKEALELQLGRPQSRQRELDARKCNGIKRGNEKFGSARCELCPTPQNHKCSYFLGMSGPEM